MALTPFKKQKAKPKPKGVSKAISAPSSTREHKSVSVEKISNGYLVRQCTSNGDRYQETTTYSAKKPQVGITVGTTGKDRK